MTDRFLMNPADARMFGEEHDMRHTALPRGYCVEITDTPTDNVTVMQARDAHGNRRMYAFEAARGIMASVSIADDLDIHAAWDFIMDELKASLWREWAQREVLDARRAGKLRPVSEVRP